MMPEMNVLLPLNVHARIQPNRTQLDKIIVLRRTRNKSARLTPYSICRRSMSAGDNLSEDFLATGRTGRRNAIAELQGTNKNESANKNFSTSDLSSKFQQLSTSDVSPDKNSPAKHGNCVDAGAENIGSSVDPAG